jgi:hypothetical protein
MNLHRPVLVAATLFTTMLVATCTEVPTVSKVHRLRFRHRPRCHRPLRRRLLRHRLTRRRRQRRWSEVNRRIMSGLPAPVHLRLN